ncbi:MAG: hypothetical protein ACOYZ8_06420 [Chloroflexota bacterium]
MKATKDEKGVQSLQTLAPTSGDVGVRALFSYSGNEGKRVRQCAFSPFESLRATLCLGSFPLIAEGPKTFFTASLAPPAITIPEAVRPGSEIVPQPGEEAKAFALGFGVEGGEVGGEDEDGSKGQSAYHVGEVWPLNKNRRDVRRLCLTISFFSFLN